MEDKKRLTALRKKLDDKVINVVKPDGMPIDVYRVKCSLNGVDATLQNGQFLHWVMTAGQDDRVQKAIVGALKMKYLLDLEDKEQCSYFFDGIVDMCIKDKDFVTSILEVILTKYKGTAVFDWCKRLNKDLGYTEIEYFNFKRKAL